MAIRIPVVVSQHERRSGSVADYEEQLITSIVMENGLDATLIADLKSIELDNTDHLCIEGLKGDFALATWESTQYVCTHLHRLGIPSLEIIPVDGSPKTSSGDSGGLPKKIFLISLATNVPIDATIKTLKSLLHARSTPLFSIGAPIHRAKSETLIPPGGVSKISIDSNPNPPAINEVANSIRADKPIAPLQSKSIEDADFSNIDQLMDELDQFQL